MNPDALAAALSRLARRNYGEEGIPMLLILERVADEALPVGEQNAVFNVPTDAMAQTAGQAFRAAVTCLDSVSHELAARDLARVIEWVADERFGPEALAAGRGDAQE